MMRIKLGHASSVCVVLFISSGCKVANPDYVGWASFEPGSSVTFEGTEIIDGRQSQLRVSEKLLSKDRDRVVLERTYWHGADDRPSSVDQIVETAKIRPTEHPLTHPSSRKQDLPEVDLMIAGESFRCRVVEAQANAKFQDWGQNVRLTAHINRRIPGGLLKLTLHSQTPDHAVELSGQATGYSIVNEQ